MFTIPIGMIKNSITKSTIYMLFFMETRVYNGTSQSFHIVPSNNESFSYFINGVAGTGSRTYSQTDQGVYTVLLQSNDSNYELDITTTTYTITAATLTLTITGDETQTHTGSQLSRTVTPSVTSSDNANAIEYLIDGTVTTGVSSIVRTNVGSQTFTLSSNDSNYVSNIASTSIIIESGSTSYKYYRFSLHAQGPTRIDYIKFMTANGSVVPMSLDEYIPTSSSKWRAKNGPHIEQSEGWFLRNEYHHYVFKNNTSDDITNYDLKMKSHTNRMPQKWQIYGSNTNGNWNFIKTVPPNGGKFLDGSNSSGNRTHLRYHYENNNLWFKEDVLPAITGNSSHPSYLGQPLNSSDFEID